jgi:hypothetical protein
MLLTAACAKNHDNFKGNAENTLDVAEPPQSISVVPATPEQCPAGGSVYTVRAGEDVLSTQILCNGRDGSDAPASPFVPVALIYLCGQTGGFDEILIRLANGQVLASMSDKANGENTRLVALPDGDYQTTDGRKCNFTLATDNGTRTVSWAGEAQASWPAN